MQEGLGILRVHAQVSEPRGPAPWERAWRPAPRRRLCGCGAACLATPPATFTKAPPRPLTHAPGLICPNPWPLALTWLHYPPPPAPTRHPLLYCPVYCPVYCPCLCTAEVVLRGPGVDRHVAGAHLCGCGDSAAHWPAGRAAALGQALMRLHCAASLPCLLSCCCAAAARLSRCSCFHCRLSRPKGGTAIKELAPWI